MLQGQIHSVNPSRSFRSLGSHRVHTFRNFKRSCVMLSAKPWGHSGAVTALSIVLSSSQMETTFPPAAQLFCCNLNRAIWSDIICDFRASLRKFLDPVLNHFTSVTWLSWGCIVLLPSDTHIKPITSITAVLLPFVTYLLTLPHIFLKWNLF
jgi:hypothetical protein